MQQNNNLTSTMKEVLKITPTIRQILLEDNSAIFVKSSLNFLLEHNGFRPGCVHIFLGPTHTGKSTMARTIIKDFLANNPGKKIMVYLSEETSLQFITELCRTGMSNEEINALAIYAETDCNNLNDPAQAFSFFQSAYNDSKPDLILFDNITTSEMYPDKCVDTQKRAVKAIKRFAQQRHIPVIIMAHTGADVNMTIFKLINENNVRGSKSSVNLTEFLYILQQITSGGEKTSTLRILKYRGQHVATSMYFLDYSLTGRYYFRDIKVDFKKFKELFKKADIL